MRHSPCIDYELRCCSLGWVLVAATQQGVCAILMGDDSQALIQDLRRRFPRATLEEDPLQGARQEWVAQVVSHLERPQGELKAPLHPHGTAFQRQVWQALTQVPAGTTISYTQLARTLGKPQSARAVAQACAANPLAVAVPCHRVLRKNGDLSGYRWGPHRKRELLAREASRVP